MATIKNISSLFDVINNSLFRTTGTLDYGRVTDAIIALSNAIAAFEGETESIWYIGECGDCTLDDLLFGAFWHYTEYHSGQGSKEYAALSALGYLVNSGMSCGDDENVAYQMLNEMNEGVV